MDTSILQQIQTDLKCPKNQYNSFGKYNYRNAEDIQEALKPILAKYGYSLTIADEVVLIGDRIYVKATVSLRNEALLAIVTTTGYARESESRKGMDDAQLTGATSSYARKYALGGMFLLDDTKDADSMKPPNDKEPEPATKQPTKTPTKENTGYSLTEKKPIKEDPSKWMTGWLKEAKKLRGLLSDGPYYEILDKHGIAHANDIKDKKKAETIFNELTKALDDK